MDKTQLLQKIATDLSAQNVLDDYQQKVSILNSANIRLGILGQPNSAKTTLINGLIGTRLPVTNLPSHTSYRVEYSADTNQPDVERDGVITSYSNSEWLKSQNLSLIEVNEDIVLDQTTPIELCSMLSQCDFCIYIVNAQAALNRTDLFILKTLSEVKMPVVLTLSRMDLIDEAEKEEIYNYIKLNISCFSNIKLVEISGSIHQSIEDIRNDINSILKNINVSKIRARFANFYLTIALGRLYEECQKKLDECDAKKASIATTTSDKLKQLDNKSTEWLSVETELRRRIRVISDKIRQFLNERKIDIVRRLSHDVDVCGDLKLFWEKDFTFRLEELVRSETGAATQLINQELLKVIQWLQNELLKRFRCKMAITTGIIGDKGATTIGNTDNVSITNTQKLKIVTRVGTAATVIAAGTMFATAGIGGIVMAVSMMSGIGAELFMHKRVNESREEIKRHLPDIVERTNLQVITEYDSKIQEVTNELATHLRTLKADWFDSTRKTIEQEKALAIFNAGSTKWETIMAQINQLSELLIK